MSISGELSELILPSQYDNLPIYMYKKAIELEVPFRFLVTEKDFSGSQGDSKYQTIFSKIREFVNVNPNISLDELREVILKVVDWDKFFDLELVPIWLHAIPEYRIEHEILLNKINEYREKLGEPDSYESMQEAISNYTNVWLPKFNEEYESDLVKLRSFVASQREIANISPVKRSPFTISSIAVSYDYTVDPGINPLPDIFNSIKNSYIIPFVQYNILPIKGQDEDVERYFKILKEESIDIKPNYGNVTLTSNQTSRGQSIYLNVWGGSDSDNAQVLAKKDKKDSFYISTISYLETANLVRFTISAPRNEFVDEWTLIRRIHEHIGPEYSLPTEVNEVRLSGDFRLYNVDLEPEFMSYLIMNDKLFSTYLYMDESSKSKTFPFKPRFNIQYKGEHKEIGQKSKSALSSTLADDIIAPDQVIQVEENSVISEYKRTGSTPSIIVTVSRSISKRIIDQYMDVLSRLFRRYIEVGRNIMYNYSLFVPEYGLVVEAQQQKQQENIVQNIAPTIQDGNVIETSVRRLTNLRKNAPDVFTNGYARLCQKQRQPIIISPTEITQWENKLVEKNGSEEQRQILNFPKDDPKHYIVCPDEEYPYPGVQENKTLENRGIYPYLPCCFQSKERAGPGLKNYYLNKKREQSSRTGYTFVGDRIVSDGREAHINTSLSSFLKDYDEESGSFIRYGVPRSTNSLIHCILHSIEDEEYMSSRDKENHVKTIRNNIYERMNASYSEIDKIYPDLLRQELHDITNEEITHRVGNQEEFFDPLLFYRLMETEYNCNIYIFSHNDKSDKASMLQLPRHKYFHVHPPVPNKRVILIIRHESPSAQDYPQCEIIVEKRGYEQKMVYDDNMNNLLYPALGFIARTLTWQIYETVVDDTSVPEMTARENIYSSMNYKTIFGETGPFAQVIDTSGKARLFMLAPEVTSQGTPTNLRIFVNVQPTSPLNIPTIDPAEIYPHLPPYEKLLEMFGDPISATSSSGNLTGLWFPMGDVQFGFYCPCKDYSWDDFVESYPNINSNSELASLTINIPRTGSDTHVSPIQRIRRLRRSASFMTQIFKYLYLVYREQKQIEHVPKEELSILLDQITTFNDSYEDSAELYDMTNINRVLPTGTIPEILQSLSLQLPAIFTNEGKIVIWDQKMRDGILYEMNKFDKTITNLKFSHHDLRQLKNYYSQKDDFNFDPQSQFILSSLKEYNDWLQEYTPSSNIRRQIIQNLKENVQSTLQTDTFTYTQPYIYQRSGNTIISSSYNPAEDKFYLIQNVVANDLRRAIQVALNWFNKKRNTGFNTEKYDPDTSIFPVHIVYRIFPGGGIIVEQNNTQGSENYLEILSYGGNLYAAMLPLM